ncbi:MAG: hypothetical protein R2695_02445 [Acidimicrobiales bacterium]
MTTSPAQSVSPSPASAAPRERTVEQPGSSRPGIVGIGALFAAATITVVSAALAGVTENPAFLVPMLVGAVLGAAWLPGHYLVQPNGARAHPVRPVQGDDPRAGMALDPEPVHQAGVPKDQSAGPQLPDIPVSKINGAEGNPIGIAVVVWRVVDTAKATFEVDDYNDYVIVQSETAIRHLGTQYPYDDFEGTRTSLRADPDVIAQSLHTGSSSGSTMRGWRSWSPTDPPRLRHRDRRGDVASSAGVSRGARPGGPSSRGPWGWCRMRWSSSPNTTSSSSTRSGRRDGLEPPRRAHERAADDSHRQHRHTSLTGRPLPHRLRRVRRRHPGASPGPSPPRSTRDRSITVRLASLQDQPAVVGPQRDLLVGQSTVPAGRRWRTSRA